MPTNLQLFIQGFKNQEKAITDFKECLKQLKIKNSALKMFIDAYVQSEDADVALAAKIGTLINNGWFTLDCGDKHPDDWSEGFDSFDDNEAYLHFIQRIGNKYEGQTFIVQFKDDKIDGTSYIGGFAMAMPQSKGKTND